MPSQQKCSQCFNRFNISRLPYLLPCTHNICEICLKELQLSPPSIVICEFCQALHPAGLPGLAYNQEIRLDIPDENELIQISTKERCILQEDLIQGSPQKQCFQTKQLCKLHKISMDIICINNKLKLCPHCALFGPHKNHTVRSIEDFRKELIEKCKIFQQIKVLKLSNKTIQTHYQLSQRIKHKLNSKKAQLTKQLNLYIESYTKILKDLQQSLQIEITTHLKEVQLYFKKNKTLMSYERTKLKFENWEKECSDILGKVQSQGMIDALINLYFNSPLESVQQGYIYINQLNKLNDQTQAKITQKIENFKLLIDTQMPDILGKSLRIKKVIVTPLSQGIKQTIQQNQNHPFLDCSSSEIDIQSYLFNQSASMEAEFTTLTNSWKGQKITLSNLQKKMSSPEKGFTCLNSMKDVEKQAVPVGNYSIKSAKSISMKSSQRLGKHSESGHLKFTQKLQKNQNSAKIPPQTTPKPFDPKEPQKIYAEFMKNTLTDFFDLSDCNMPNEKIVEYVYRAKKSHKIKGLKLCSNQMTTEGFEKLSECLRGVCNINLANNRVDQRIFEVIAKNREKIDSLRILNLSHNPINLQKKSKLKFQEIKKMGIIVIL